MPAVPMTYDEYIDSLEAEATGRATPLRTCDMPECDGALRGVVSSHVVERKRDATRVDVLTCKHAVL